MKSWKKKLMASGFAVGLTVAGLAACGDGVDQDNGVDDGEVNDEQDDKNEENG
ncbi:hypothetical protein [Peribacillus alkalitolerans]|uniref:hypothetical protein n=1 Tax=Peribacillus alkalitolerans TaxID=1550385 RepID=UPI001967830B|nr:hypothetical protein [Peribacillus alkalitolerans]